MQAEYQRRWRQRRAQGLAVLPICLPIYPVISALIESGRLTPAEALDRRAVEAACRDVLEDFARRWDGK